MPSDKLIGKTRVSERAEQCLMFVAEDEFSIGNAGHAVMEVEW